MPTCTLFSQSSSVCASLPPNSHDFKRSLIDLLKIYGIKQLIDVRTIAKSRHNPQFNEQDLLLSLSKEKIKYLHDKELGGLRHAKKDSINNHEDEGKFSAQLTPTTGKLGFEVDFYGRGYFPPGAYHSEGHQDGMGICLYLALMKHQLGKSFTFAVLDDVLMSVDAGHRREVCNLLKERFPGTQFILTTHDPIWLKHMRTVGLISSQSSSDREPRANPSRNLYRSCRDRIHIFAIKY